MKKKIKNVSRSKQHRKKKRSPRVPLSQVPQRLNLVAIEKFYESGLIDPQVAKACGVSERTIHNYKHNTIFSAVVKRGREKRNDRIVNSAFKRALGYSYAEVTMEPVLEIHTEGGIKKKVCLDETLKVTKSIIKHVPADPGTIQFLLTNWMKDEYKNRFTFADGGEKVEPRTYHWPVINGVLQLPKSVSESK